MRKKRSKREIKENRDGFLFALPFIIGFLLFSLYPIIMSFYYGFTDFSAIKTPTWVGLENYISLFHDDNFYLSLKNTLIFTALTVPLTIILGLLIAMLLKNVRVGQTLFRGIFYIPSIFPVVAVSMIWILLFDYNSGYLNRCLRLLGISGLNWLGDPDIAKMSLVIMACWSIGTMVVIFVAAMQDVPAELYEAASIDGAGIMTQFLRITIPRIAHVILYQIILAIINGFQYFTQVYVFTTLQSGNLNYGKTAGPKNSLLVYPLYLFRKAFTYLEMGEASAMAWILFAIVGILTFILVKISGKWMDI